jgi:hypothetical protein
MSNLFYKFLLSSEYRQSRLDSTWKQELAVWQSATVEITLEIRDHRTLRNPSPLEFVEIHGGTNANETLLARLGGREWYCVPVSCGIRSDRQSAFILGSLDGAGYLRRRRSNGGRAGYSKEN